jgi:hypothetical protein
MAAGGAAAAIQAIKASGVVVKVEAGEFLKLAGRAGEPLIVTATDGLFRKSYRYLMAYKGLAFHTKSAEPLRLPAAAEVVAAKRIWIP